MYTFLRTQCRIDQKNTERESTLICHNIIKLSLALGGHEY
jgi:hypothetical protein